MRIPYRRSFSGHIGQKYQSVTSRIHFFGNFIQLIQRGNSCLFFHQTLVISKLSLKPAHNAASACGSSLKKPFARNHMESQNQAGIRLILFHADTHPASLTALFLRLTGMDHTCSQSTAGSIQTSCCHRRSFCKSGFFCCFFCHCSYNLITWYDFRKKFSGDSQFFTHFFIPLSGTHIKTVESITL